MISIDVSNTQINIAEINVKGINVSLIKTKSVPIELPIFDNEQNLNEEALLLYLKDALIEFPSKEVYISLSCMTQATNEYTLMYDKKPKQLEQIVMSKVFTTLSPNDYAMDYRILDIFTEENIQKCSVITYVVPKNVIKSVFDILVKIGKKPIKFAITQNSVFNFIKAYIKNESCIFVNVDYKSILLQLYNSPHNIITRTAPISSPQQESSSLDILGDLNSGNINTLHNQVIEIVSKVLQYQIIKYPDRQVNTIYVFGENVDNGLYTALKDANDVPVLMLNQFNNSFIKSNNNDFTNFIYCIGNVIK